MAGERREDDALRYEAELARLLDVQPSPDFAARVRQRIQTAPPRAAWGFAWAFAAAAVVVATIAVAYVARLTPVDVPPAPAAVRAWPVPDELTLPSAPDVAQPEAPPVRRAVLARAEPERSTQVIVDARQREALHRLLAMTNAGRLDERVFPTLTTEPLDVPLLVVSPLEKHPER
jgi:hypothetical protein